MRVLEESTRSEGVLVTGRSAVIQTSALMNQKSTILAATDQIPRCESDTEMDGRLRRMTLNQERKQEQ